MSAREMHDLERTALEDPFLADALEGFEKQEQPDDLNEHLDDLRVRLDTRVTVPARKLFPWLRIAAAAILLIGLGAGAWYGLLNKNKEQALVSQSKVPAAAPAPLAAADTVTKTAPADTPKTGLSNGENLLAKAEPARKMTHSRTIPPAPATSRAEYKSAAPASPVSSTASSSPADSITHIASNSSSGGSERNISLQKDTAAYNAEVAVQAYGMKRFSPDLSRSKLAEAHPLVFSGKVLDVHNNPLPGASLFLAGPTGNSPVGIVTDLNGNFSLKVYPKDSVLKVTVGMAGYRQTSLAFNTLNTGSATGNLIHLEQQPNALDEVVVSGYGAKRKETRARASFAGDEKIDSLWITAAPVMGKQAYLDYLAAGKKNIGADTSIKGTVIISFDVTKKGELTSFKVEQSLTPAHDAGVIHLISEGPPWKKVSKGRPVRTAVRVVF